MNFGGTRDKIYEENNLFHRAPLTVLTTKFKPKLRSHVEILICKLQFAILNLQLPISSFLKKPENYLKFRNQTQTWKNQ